MVDPTEAEMQAMAAASDKAGEFIESLRQTDMAKWKPQQWQQFIEVVCGSYVDSLCEQQAAINAALERARAA
ncbi:MAG: hypothetical protein K2X46_14175 [Roseomonas sp.]|nr:hypothetical protein [Roseomonas sp.]